MQTVLYFERGEDNDELRMRNGADRICSALGSAVDSSMGRIMGSVMDSMVSDALHGALLPAGHIGVAIGIMADILARQHLVPDARREVTPVSVVEVVAVAAQGVAHALARRRYGFPAGDKQQRRMVAQHIFGSTSDRIVHNALARLVQRESRVACVLRIGPRPMPAEPRRRLIAQHTVHQRREVRLVGACNAAVVRRLLQGDIVPAVVAQRPQEGVRLVAHGGIVGEVAELVCRSVAHKETVVLRKGATAIVQVADDDGLPSALTGGDGVAKRHQFLLDGIPRETIADTQNADGVVSPSRRHHHHRYRHQTT